MKRPGRRANTALCLLAVILCASAASARTERFRWTEATTVASFKLYWGNASGSYSTSQNVGLPAKDSTGAYYYDILVADTATIYATVTATSGGLESVKSNEISRAPSTGGTTPPPPPTTASAAIVGFTLWNALNDTVVDSDFRSGEAISDAVRGCASIEIKGNAYLNGSGAGSVKKVFDGVNNGCSGNGVENSPPYAWEDGGTAGQFACAPSLSAIGSHTLTVTPYDGDNCSGLAGAPASLSFTVTGPSSTGSTVGAPGQPYIVQ